MYVSWAFTSANQVGKQLFLLVQARLWLDIQDISLSGTMFKLVQCQINTGGTNLHHNFTLQFGLKSSNLSSTLIIRIMESP